MNYNCFVFGFRNIRREEIAGKRVLEVGSRDVNGSVRPLIETYGPREYVGADIIAGPGVDVICDAAALADRFGAESFDAVICTEMMEHVRDWRAVIHSIKTVCRKGGSILITTRSRGFPYHGWPYDFWRYEREDMEYIFRDCLLERLEPDPQSGIMLKCVKPAGFVEREPGDLALYSVVTRRKTVSLSDRDLRAGAFRRRVFAQRVKEFLLKKIDSLFPRDW